MLDDALGAARISPLRGAAQTIARAPHAEWFAIALAALFAFTGLANHPLQAADEPRVAGIAWEMQHTGDWWVPHLSGAPFLEHPPLFYAVLGVFIEQLGAAEWVARLPGAIASFVTALLVFTLARRLADRTAGLPSLFALIGIAGFARYSHRAVVDPMLAMFAMAGYYAYVRAVWNERSSARSGGSMRVAPAWLFTVYLAAGFAFWVKGPIGVVAIAGPLALDALIARRWRVIASPVHLVGVPLLAAACLAWLFVLEQSNGHAATQTFLLNNGWYRIAPSAGAGQYVGGHVKPFWYYLPRSFGQLGWVALFVPAAAAWLWRGAAPAGWCIAALRFLAWVFPIGVVLLSIPGTKRGLYLLPFEAPLAVAIGAWIAAAARNDGNRTRAERAVTVLCARALRPLQPFVAKLYAGERIAADLEHDVARAATGACRAPHRIAAIAFAIAIGWNAIGLRFTGRDGDLEPLARAVEARVGSDGLFVLNAEECVLGALPFYTGRIPYRSSDLEQVITQPKRSRARFLLAPLSMREQIAAKLGSGVVLQEIYKGHEDREYGIFELLP